MQLAVRLKCGVLACTAALLAACVEIPGYFYQVRLPEPQPNTVCMDLGRELSSRLSLQVVDQTFPVSPKGSCIIDLDFQGHSPPRAPINLGYDPPSQYIGIRVGLLGTQELASRMASIVAERFPGATITEIHPKQGFAP